MRSRRSARSRGTRYADVHNGSPRKERMTTDLRDALRTQVFLGEIELQCRLASIAAERLKTSHDRFDALEMWGAIQSILVASANVSKILWPRRAYAARGAHLRSLLSLGRDHPLSERTFRNHFEHYDERSEKWLTNVQTSVYTDQVIGELPWPLRDFPQNAHRHFDPASLTISFRGESLSLSELLRSLADVLARCRAAVYAPPAPPE